MAPATSFVCVAQTRGAKKVFHLRTFVALDHVMNPAEYARFRAATERLRNRAVFEIPDILERIMLEHDMLEHKT